MAETAQVIDRTAGNKVRVGVQEKDCGRTILLDHKPIGPTTMTKEEASYVYWWLTRSLHELTS